MGIEVLERTLAELEKVVESLKKEIAREKEKEQIVVAADGDENLIFNISCLEDFQKKEVGDWIFYVNAPTFGPEADCAIWKVKKDGSENKKVQKSVTGVFGIVDITEKWIYFCDDSPRADEMLKMNLLGGMEQEANEEEREKYEDEFQKIYDLWCESY